MKKIILVLLALSFTFSLGCSIDDTGKTGDTLFPGEIQRSNGKGDWRTRNYTDIQGAIAVGDTQFGTYAPAWPDYFFAYTYQAEAGDTVGIKVGANSPGFDAVAGIYGPQRADGSWGSLIAVNDDSAAGGTYDSYIEHEVETSGVYLILFKEYNWNAGDFFVTTDCLGGSCEEVVCPQLRCAGCPTGTVYDENGCATCGCEDTCPEAIQPPPYVRCAGIVSWAKSASGECCQYPSPCMVPPNMDRFDTEEACEDPTTDENACSLYGRQCPEGSQCALECPDGSNDPNCNMGINPSGTCVQSDVCTDGETKNADDSCNTCQCNGGQWSCTEMACATECTTDSDCITTGCSGQVCAPQAVITTCQYDPEYACYNSPTTSCGCNNGSCGWDQTDALDSCISSL